MTKLVAPKKETRTKAPAGRLKAAGAERGWHRLLASPTALEDEASRQAAWDVLAWAEQHAALPAPQPLVPAEKSETGRVVAAVLLVLSHPPQDATPAERVQRCAAWAARLNHPLVHVLHGVRATEAGAVRAALEVFERLKCVGSAFPEVPLTAGRALLHAAGGDSKLLHKAEWYLVHAEHLYLEGGADEEVDASGDTDVSADSEPMECDVTVDMDAQVRLAEIWSLMAALYERLGDPRKSAMYRSRSGACPEERDEPADESEAAGDDFVDEPSLKPTDRKLIRGFLQSAQFSGLPAAEQKQSRATVPYFVALGRAYLGLAPARLDRYALEELLLGLLPETLVAPTEEMGRIPSVLMAWVHYLGKAGLVRDAGRLVPLIARLAADFMANCRNPDCWGVPKALAMRALAGPDRAKEPARLLA